jgi:GntR family transcriptional regulator/MocR family aminotransferase
VGDRTGPVDDWRPLLALQRGTGAPLHDQLEVRLRDLIRGGQLRAGAKLPSSRALAAALGVSRGIVLESYAQLIAEGYLTSSQGAPTRVAAGASAERPPLPAQSMSSDSVVALAPGRSDPDGFPRAAWLRSMRSAVTAVSAVGVGDAAVVDGLDPRGTPELRNALMEYLVRARAAAPEPEHTLISTGFTQAFAVLCGSLAARGLESIAVEEPGWSRHRMVAERSGLEPVPIAVDEQGVRVAELALSGCEAVVVTPAHQYPSGVVLGAERRAELLEWAEERDGLIIEDDYDSELRYDRGAVGALQGLAPERVCHIGSASARLGGGVRIGWTLSPSWLTGALSYESAVAGVAPSGFEQLALAEMIAHGELDRHLRRTRVRYGARRELLVAALARVLPDAAVSGIAGGLFVPVFVDGVAPALTGVGELAEPYLLLGFADLDEEAIERGVEALAREWRSWT